MASSRDKSSNHLRPLTVTLGQFITGFWTPWMLFYPFLLVVFGPSFLIDNYFDLTSLTNQPSFIYALEFMYWTSPMAIGLLLLRYLRRKRLLVKSTRGTFYIGLWTGLAAVAPLMFFLLYLHYVAA